MSLLLLFQGGGPAAAFTSLGWFAALSGAPHPLPVAQSELRPFGVQQVAAVVAPQGWQGQTSQPAPRPPVQLGSTFVPLNTTQVIVTPPSGWAAPLSQAVAKPPTQQGASVVPLRDRFVVEYGWHRPLATAVTVRQAPQSPTCQFTVQLPAGAVATEGWQRPLSVAAARPPVQSGSTFVPFNTAQVVAVTDRYGWWQPASLPPPRLPAPQSELRPFGVQQVAGAVATEGWQRPLNTAAPQPPLQTGSTFVPLNTRQVNTQTIDKWLVPLSVAKPVPYPAPQGASFVPLNTAQIFAAVYGGAFPPLSVAAPIPRPAPQGASFVPLDTRQVVRDISWLRPLATAVQQLPRPPRQTVSIAYPLPDEEHFRWWRQLSEPVAIPRPPSSGFAVVPYNTTQAVAVAVYGWWQPASKAPPALPVVQPELRPFGLQQVAGAVATEGWQAPLSRPAPQPPVQQGSSFVPLNTTQVVVTPAYGWVRPLSVAAPQPPAWSGSAFVPLDTRQQNTQTIDKWLVPLSVARAIPYPAPQGYIAWVGQPLAGNNVGWGNYQQPLSRPADRPPVWQGTSLVPFNTTQVVFNNTIDYSLYMQPLSRAVPIPYTTFTVGWTFVPFDTTQVAVVSPPGRGPVMGLWPPQSELDRQWRRRQKQEIAEVEVEVAEVKAAIFDEQSEIDEIAEIREIYDLIRNTKRRPD